ncbi:MAG TPA: hypothetical protein VF972_06575 [Actinomycetota bacterium]
MTGLLLVAVALGGLSAYVWSAIDRAEAQRGVAPSTGPGPEISGGAVRSGPFRGLGVRMGDLHPLRRGRATLVRAVAAVGTMRSRSRSDRTQRRSARRRIRFEETAVLTIPPAAEGLGGGGSMGWDPRPSRMVSAIQLVLLVLIVGAAVAGGTLFAAHALARAVGH